MMMSCYTQLLTSVCSLCPPSHQLTPQPPQQQPLRPILSRIPTALTSSLTHILTAPPPFHHFTLMPLSRLAKVELQLVMHGLDLALLLRLARCSRLTLAAASEAFAWRQLPLLTFDISRVPNVGTRLQSARLLRHSEFKLVSLAAQPDQLWFVQRCEQVLPELAATPRLRVLHVGRQWSMLFNLAGWTRFLSLPSVRGLTHLHAGYLGEADVASFLQQLVTHIPHLTSLEARMEFGNDNAASLPQLTRLTHLAVHDRKGRPTHSGVLRIGECTSLRSLALCDLDEATFTPLLTSPGLQQLHTLEVDRVRAQGSRDGTVLAPDWAACFAHLTHLTSLTLKHCHGVDTVLQTISLHAPQIRSLLLLHSKDSIALYGHGVMYADYCRWCGSELPTPDTLEQLASSRPHLHITVCFPSLDDILRARARGCMIIRHLVPHPWILLFELTEQGVDSGWCQLMRAALPPLLTPDRFTIELEDESRQR